MFLRTRPPQWPGLTLAFVSVAALALAFAGGCAHSSANAPVAAAVAAPQPATATPTTTPGDPDVGAAVYARICLGCHQFNGQGLPGAFPPLAGSPLVTDADPGKVIRIVLHGLQGPIQVKGTTFNSIMPPPAPALTDQDIADVLTYVRSDWGNEAAPVTVEAVTAIRAQGARTTPWTWAELEKL